MLWEKLGGTPNQTDTHGQGKIPEVSRYLNKLWKKANRSCVNKRREEAQKCGAKWLHGRFGDQQVICISGLSLKNWENMGMGGVVERGYVRSEESVRHSKEDVEST